MLIVHGMQRELQCAYHLIGQQRHNSNMGAPMKPCEHSSQGIRNKLQIEIYHIAVLNGYVTVIT